MSEIKIGGFFRSVLRAAAMPFLWLYNKVILGFKVTGRENLRLAKKLYGKGLITVSNHVNPMDCSMCAHAIFPISCNITTIGQNFDRAVAGRLVSVFGAVPIPKSPGQLGGFMENCRRHLERGGHLQFYPEGELRPYSNTLSAFRRGAFLLAARAGVPIVPIVYVQRKQRGLVRLFRQGKCAFRAIVCPPQMPSPLLFERAASEELLTRVQDIMTGQLIRNPAKCAAKSGRRRKAAKK